MKTVTDNIHEWADHLRALLSELESHSSLRRWIYPDSVVFDFRGDHEWAPLDDAGCQAQGRLLEEYRRFIALLTTLLAGQPNETVSILKEESVLVLAVIQQDDSSWAKQAQEAFTRAKESLEKLAALPRRLYDSAAGRTTLVPDTNALLFNPGLEDWRFEDFARFTILLLPPVLGELDALKVNHRVEGVRQKAERLINQIKEYRRRGRLTDGVPLVTDVSDIMAVATEPKFQETLPWLDSANQDDRILAGVVEAMRMRPHSPLIFITRDINLQNKAEFARLPYMEPPAPKATN